MRCIHITSRKALLILFSFLINGVQHSQMADNSMDISTKDHSSKNATSSDLSATQGFIRQYHIVKKNVNQGDVSYCPLSEDKKDCSQLSAECWRCELNYSCTYGEELLAKCSVLDPTMKCKGDKTFHIPYVCRYCYQTESWEHICTLKANCNSIATSRSPYMTNCTVKEDVLCLGKRTFFKNVLCNWTGGYRWSTALILSVTLGGFGADRFYLGHWQEGIGKLFSFGGLGVWTLIDVILISLHYLGPADGSLYI